MELRRLGLKRQGVSVPGCLHVWVTLGRAKKKNSLQYVRVQGEVSDETGKEVQDVKASNPFLPLLFLSPQIPSLFFLPLPDRSPGLRKSPVRLITYNTYIPEYVAQRNWTCREWQRSLGTNGTGKRERTSIGVRKVILVFGFLGFWANWFPVEQEIHIERLITLTYYQLAEGNSGEHSWLGNVRGMVRVCLPYTKTVRGQTDELSSGTSRKGRAHPTLFLSYGINRVEAEIYPIQSLPFQLQFPPPPSPFS